MTPSVTEARGRAVADLNEEAESGETTEGRGACVAVVVGFAAAALTGDPCVALGGSIDALLVGPVTAGA